MKLSEKTRRVELVRAHLENQAAQAYAFLLDTAGVWADYWIRERREAVPVAAARRRWWRAHRLAVYANAAEPKAEAWFYNRQLRNLYDKIRRGRTLALLMAAGEQPERSAR